MQEDDFQYLAEELAKAPKTLGSSSGGEVENPIGGWTSQFSALEFTYENIIFYFLYNCAIITARYIQ